MINTDPGDEQIYIFGTAQTDTNLRNRILAAILNALLKKHNITLQYLTANYRGQGTKLPDAVAAVRGEFIYLATEIGIAASVAGEYIFIGRGHSATELKRFKKKCTDDKELIELAGKSICNEFKTR